VESGNNILKNYFNRRAQSLKEFLAKMKDFVREWSTLEKTSFPIQYNYKERVRNQAKILVETESILKIEEMPGFLFCLRKRLAKDQKDIVLEKFTKRKHLPANAEELHEGWGCLRVINTLHQTCDCGNFQKYGYCKHIIALKII